MLGSYLVTPEYRSVQVDAYMQSVEVITFLDSATWRSSSPFKPIQELMTIEAALGTRDMLGTLVRFLPTPVRSFMVKAARIMFSSNLF